VRDLPTDDLEEVYQVLSQEIDETRQDLAAMVRERFTVAAELRRRGSREP